MFNRDKNHDATLVRCHSCGSPLGNENVCRCGAGTKNMSFAERNEFELAQYKAYKAKVASA